MRNLKYLFILFFLFLSLMSCFSSSNQKTTDNITIVKETEIVIVTKLVKETVIVEVPVTVTSSPTPKDSPTPSNTPTITPTPTITLTLTNTPLPTATPDYAKTATIEAYGELTKPKRNGFFTVGQEILQGKWESQGSGDGCYWAVYDEDQEILKNHFGNAGGTVNILQTHYEVEFDDCGEWIYVEGADRELKEDADQDKNNGFYTIGVEIAPGKWQSQGSGDSCYWSIYDGNQNILRNHFGNAGGTVTLSSSHYEVEFSDCGTWIYLGP